MVATPTAAKGQSAWLGWALNPYGGTGGVTATVLADMVAPLQAMKAERQGEDEKEPAYARSESGKTLGHAIKAGRLRRGCRGRSVAAGRKHGGNLMADGLLDRRGGAVVASWRGATDPPAGLGTVAGAIWGMVSVVKRQLRFVFLFQFLGSGGEPPCPLGPWQTSLRGRHPVQIPSRGQRQRRGYFW